MKYINLYWKLMHEQSQTGNIARLITNVIFLSLIQFFWNSVFFLDAFNSTEIWLSKIALAIMFSGWLCLQTWEFIRYALSGLIYKNIGHLVYQIVLLMIVLNIGFGILYSLLFWVLDLPVNIFLALYTAFAVNYSIPLQNAIEGYLTSNFVFMIVTTFQILISKAIEIIIIGVLANVVMEKILKRKT